MSIADPLVYPVLTEVLTLLMTELGNTAAGQPLHARIIPGTELVAALTEETNECCEGIAAVRGGNLFPTNDFPSQSATPIMAGGPETGWTLEVEMAVVRCGVQPGPDMAPDDAALTSDASTQWNDAAALRRVGYKLPLNSLSVFDVTMGQYQPLPADGDCLGGTLTLQVHVDCKEV